MRRARRPRRSDSASAGRLAARRGRNAIGGAHEQFRIVASAHAGGDDAIVARQLAIFAQTARNPPHARMKPVQRAADAPDAD